VECLRERIDISGQFLAADFFFRFLPRWYIAWVAVTLFDLATGPVVPAQVGGGPWFGSGLGRRARLITIWAGELIIAGSLAVGNSQSGLADKSGAVVLTEAPQRLRESQRRNRYAS